MQAISRDLSQIIALLSLLVILVNVRASSRIVDSLDGPESCHLRELELCSMGLVSIFQNPNGLPMKQVELDRQCAYFNESAECLDKYSHNCLTPIQHGLVHMFTKNSMQMVEDFCRPGSELRINYTRHIECYRDIQRKFQKNCLTDFQVGFEGLHRMNRSDRLTTACCNLNRLKECFFGPISYDCGLQASETVEKLLMNIFGTWFTLPCRAFDPENEDCKRLLPPIGSKPHSFTNVPAQL